MLDIALIREKPEYVKAQLAKLNDPKALTYIDEILELDKKRRTLLTESERIQAARNKLNKAVGMLRGSKTLDTAAKNAQAAAAVAAIATGDYDAAERFMTGSDAAPSTADGTAMDDLMAALKNLGERVEQMNDELRVVDAKLDETMLWVPNMPHSSVPIGEDDSGNKAWQMEGELREFEFEPKPHWDLGAALDIIDFERGVKLAGTRGYVLKGWRVCFWIWHARRGLKNSMCRCSSRKR
jgi:seryl-tRNA synthetase